VCGAELVSEVENFLYGPVPDGPFPKMDLDAAHQTLDRMLTRIAMSGHKTRRGVTEEVAGVLGVLCADGLLCPLATAIAIYRVATMDGGITSDDATEAAVIGMRHAMADRAQERE
jgi:hypothetical protein